jgi:hypothetical protein
MESMVMAVKAVRDTRMSLLQASKIFTILRATRKQWKQRSRSFNDHENGKKTSTPC